MGVEHEIHKIHKVGIRGNDHYLIARGKTSYLRIVGDFPRYTIMTVTANEDRGGYRACADRFKLNEAAKLLGKMLGTRPYTTDDWCGRCYTIICGYQSDTTDVRKELSNHPIVSTFFEFFDGPPSSSSHEEMIGLYNSLSDGSGDDLYLSDGVWITPDGAMRDERG